MYADSTTAYGDGFYIIFSEEMNAFSALMAVTLALFW